MNRWDVAAVAAAALIIGVILVLAVGVWSRDGRTAGEVRPSFENRPCFVDFAVGFEGAGPAIESSFP